MPQNIDAQHARWNTALQRLAYASDWNAEEIGWCAGQVKAHRKRLRWLGASIAKKNIVAMRRHQDHILNSFAGRFCAALDVLVPASASQSPKPISFLQFDALLQRIRPNRRI